MSEPRGFQYFGKTPAGVEMALQLDVDPGMAPKKLADYLKGIDAELKAAGFTRSDRLDKPVGGWGGGKGQPRAETPPPAGIERPEHCGTPMRYVKYRKEGAKGAPERGLPEGWADMWVCAKDKQCEDVTSGRSEKAAANFKMHPEKPQEPADATPKGDPHQPAAAHGSGPASPSGRPTAADFSAFWPKVRELGYTPAQVQDMAGKPVPDCTKAELAELWAKLKAAAVGVAVGA